MPQKGFIFNYSFCYKIGRSSYFVAFGLALVAVVVAAGVLLWWRLQAPVGEVVAPQAPQEEGQPPADETTDWQTYRNEEYGFEVRYPGDFQITAEGTVAWSTFKISKKEGEMYYGYEITISRDRDNRTLNEWADSLKNKGKEISAHSLSGLSALKITFDDSVYTRKVTLIMVKKDNRMYQISDEYTNRTTDRAIAIFNQILSFFRFLE